MSTSAPNPRVVTIAGATGTGKSQLAVALAERFNGEIINSDAMQMYEGLPIATNKIPVLERKSIAHHLLGCIKTNEEPWQVGKYVHAATRIIEDIVARGKLPILVGGTHYYTQSLLFKGTILHQNEPEWKTTEAQEIRWPILAASTPQMLEYLRHVDPEMASKWHPNDRRKIRHSLEVYLTSGREPSAIYRDQRKVNSREDSCELLHDQPYELGPDKANNRTPSLQLDPIILWTYADLEKLSARLDQRVERMVQEGLIDEVLSMQQDLRRLERNGLGSNQSSGIWTAIGYKELAPYVTASLAGNISGEHLEKLKQKGVELTKIATRQYARRQHRWIRGKLLRELQAQNALDKIVLLDSTELSQWNQRVEETAINAVSAFLKGDPLPASAASPKIASELLVPKADANIKARHCDICNVTIMTQQAWDTHSRSKRHRKATRTPIDWQALYPKSHGRNHISRVEIEVDSG
ncbi:MAG: hypothetical protein Q9218_000852 [Villophora microphyllina]